MNGSTPLGGLRQSVTDGSSPQTMVTNTFQYRLRKKVFLVLAVIAKLWLAHGRDLFQELPAQREMQKWLPASPHIASATSEVLHATIG